jgi:TRAP-type C4-dicarboxylate transport system permease small subunit
MTFMDRLLDWLERPINVLLWIGIVAGFLMMLHVTVDVAGRTLFNRPLPGTTEIVSGWYMIAVAYLPWAFIAREDAHIQVDLFTRHAPQRFQAVLDIAVKLVTAAWVLLFSYQTFIRALQQTRVDEVWEAAGFLIPVWPSRWLLPVAGLSMGLYLLLRVARDVTHGPSRPVRATGG